MPSTTFTMRLDETTKKALEAEAKLKDRSAAYIAKQAITQMLDREAYKREKIGDAVREADNGVFISEEAMDAWVNSWGSDKELPPPKPDIFPEPEKL
ncbi:MAG: hypothetical protein AAGG69_04910 [Pseudomonadota bacterium]